MIKLQLSLGMSFSLLHDWVYGLFHGLFHASCFASFFGLVHGSFHCLVCTVHCLFVCLFVCFYGIRPFEPPKKTWEQVESTKGTQQGTVKRWRNLELHSLGAAARRPKYFNIMDLGEVALCLVAA